MLSKVSTCVLLFAPLALAHGHVDEIWAPWTPTPVTHYDGWNPNDLTVAYPNNTPGWYTTNSGGNPLYPVDLPQNQIICAKGASNANLR
jgi:cellulase